MCYLALYSYIWFYNVVGSPHKQFLLCECEILHLFKVKWDKNSLKMVKMYDILESTVLI